MMFAKCCAIESTFTFLAAKMQYFMSNWCSPLLLCVADKNGSPTSFLCKLIHDKNDHVMFFECSF